MTKVKKPLWRRVIRIVLFTLLTLFSLIVLLLGVSVYMYNHFTSPEKLTSIVNNTVKRFVDAEVDIVKVNVSLFSSFPEVEIAIDSGAVVSGKNRQTIVSFDKVYVNISPFALLLNNEIKAKQILIEKPVVNYIINRDSTTNFDIFYTSEEQEQMEEDSVSSGMMKVDIGSISIVDAEIKYVDRMSKNRALLKGLDIDIKIQNQDSIALLKSDISVKEYSMHIGGRKIEKNKDLFIHLDSELNKISRKLSLNKSSISLNGVGLNLSGDVDYNNDENYLFFNVDYSLQTPTLQTVMAFVPKGIIDEGISLNSKGKIEMFGDIKGKYNKTTFPIINTTLKMDKVSAKYAGMPMGIEELSVDALVNIDLNEEDSSYARINKFVVRGGDGALDVDLKGKVERLFGNMSIGVVLNSSINYEKVDEIYPLVNTITISGESDIDIQSQFTLEDINKGRYNKILANGDISAKNIDFVMYADSVRRDSSAMVKFLQVKTLSISATNRGVGKQSILKVAAKSLSYSDKDKSRVSVKQFSLSGDAFNSKSKGYQKIRINAAVDNFRGRDQTKKRFNISKLSLNGTGYTVENSRIPIMKLGVTLSRLNAVIPDTLNASLNSITISGGVKPYERDLNRAAFTVDIIAEKVVAIAPKTEGKSSIGHIEMQASLLSPEKDSKIWGIGGIGELKNLSALLNMFPLDFNIENSSFKFDNKDIVLNRTNLKLGKSNIAISGKLHNLLGKMFLDKGDIEGELSITSQFIDTNEIMGVTVNIPSSDTEEVEVDSVSTNIFVVPSRVKLKLHTDLKKVLFNRFEINNVRGDIELEDEQATLTKFSLNTLGANMELYAKYKAKDTTSADLGFELNVRSIDIEKFTELIPSINTMMPMIKSIKGNIGLSMVAKTTIGKGYAFDLSTLETVIGMHGSNLVLMDSKDFAKISKMLMFRNKKENLVSQLDIRIIAKDDKAELLPTMINIDRYKLIAGGVQGFNMTYNYNVSIIKSPLPFKAGVDISDEGDGKGMDIDITRAKLKKTNFEDVKGRFDKEYQVISNDIK